MNSRTGMLLVRNNNTYTKSSNTSSCEQRLRSPALGRSTDFDMDSTRTPPVLPWLT